VEARGKYNSKNRVVSLKHHHSHHHVTSFCSHSITMI